MKEPADAIHRQELSSPSLRVRIAAPMGSTTNNTTGNVAVELSGSTEVRRLAQSQESLRLFKRDRNERFENEIMPHLDAGFNLALWLLHDHNDAEDATQSALFKALRGFDRRRNADAKPWFLAIIRNECIDQLNARTAKVRTEAISADALEYLESKDVDPQTAAIKSFTGEAILDAIRQLPAEFREVVVLRELEEMSYLEIAVVISIPIGTVMSRIARARARLLNILSEEVDSR